MKTCVCHIVPRYIKEILINDGLLDPTVAAETMDFDRFFRLQRSRKSYQLMAGVAAPGPSGTAARTVCDCRNTKKLHQNILRVEGHAPVLDPDANLAYDNVGIVRDYYKNVLKRDSLDDRGLDLELNIHYENGYDNAAWNGEVMVFGDGKKFFGHLVRGLDVIAHELTHGVVQYTAGFTDEEFPGTLNEHFADVMATVIKQYNRNENAQTGNWLIGEDIILPTFPGTALRSLKSARYGI